VTPVPIKLPIKTPFLARKVQPRSLRCAPLMAVGLGWLGVAAAVRIAL
jgi:hypothetical protein